MKWRVHTGNCCFPLLMARVVKHVGMFVFFTSLSSAQTLSDGGLLRSSCIRANRQPAPKKQVSLYSKLYSGASEMASVREGGGKIHSYRYSHQEARSLDLAHVGNGADIVGLEALDDLPIIVDDADVAVVGTEEDALRPRSHARYLVALKGLSCFVVGEPDLGDVKEVKRLPLKGTRQIRG